MMLQRHAGNTPARRAWPCAAGIGRLALLGACLSTPALAQAPPPEPALRPLVARAGGEHHVGKMVIAELATPDLQATKAFYGGLLGWTFQDVMFGSTPLAEASAGGRPVAVLIQRPLPGAAAAGSGGAAGNAAASAGQMQPAWVAFLAVRDVAGAKDAALQAGAKLLFGPRAVAGLGDQAVLADPQGAVFGLLTSSSGDPPDTPAEPGQWIWSSLITSEPDTDAAFYQTLLGYDVYDMPGDEDARHFIIASDGYARASANPLPTPPLQAGRTGMRPHWLNFVRTDDTAATTAKVAALGGRVLVPPQLDRHGARIAVVADPMGAPFGLMEWPYAAKPGQAK